VIGPINVDGSVNTGVHVSSAHATSGVILGVECQGGCGSDNITDNQASPAYNSGATNNNATQYWFGGGTETMQPNFTVNGTITANEYCISTSCITSWPSGGGAVWGGITGALANQIDLQVALNLLAPLASPTFTGTPTVPGYATLASPTFTGTPAAPTATAGDNSTKLATTAYVRGEAQMTFTCPVAGAGALVQYCNWTLPAAITVTGFDLAAGTAPLTCSTYATLQVWDGYASGAEVGSFSIPMTSGNNFYSQVTGSTNVPAGHLLRVKVTTAAAGCGTVAAGIVATVTYQMQN